MTRAPHRPTTAGGERPGARELAAGVVRGFRQNDLLTYASAIAFQVLSAIVPFLLFVVGMLGFLDLTEVWREDLAPDVRDRVSAAAFEVVDDTVRRVLGSKQVFWVTAGAALSVWEISGAVRAVMGALDGVYGAPKGRTLRDKLPTSLWLAVAVSLCLLAAAVVVRFGPVLLEVGSAPAAALFFVARFGAATVLVALAVGLLVRYAPATPQPFSWVSFGTGIVIAAWIGMSLAFGFYLSSIASYGSLFGHLATAFVLLTYLYLAAVVFLAGVQLDAAVRLRVEGDPAGEPEREPALPGG